MSNDVTTASEKSLEIIKSLEHSNQILILEVKETEAEKAKAEKTVAEIKEELAQKAEELARAEQELQAAEQRLSESEEELSAVRTAVPEETNEVEQATKLLERAAAVSEEHVKEAQAKADEIVAEAQARKVELESETRELEQYRENLVRNLKDFLVESLNEVEKYSSEDSSESESTETTEDDANKDAFEQGLLEFDLDDFTPNLSLELDDFDIGEIDFAGGESLEPSGGQAPLELEEESSNLAPEGLSDIDTALQDFNSHLDGRGVSEDSQSNEIDEIIETINEQRD